mgnify:CR=1 FL=1
MNKSFSVLNSDQINKYGYFFPISTMEDMMWMKATEGVPMHLGHDMHRPIGCMIPYALYFEPYLVRNIGITLIPETDEENKQIHNFKRYSAYKNVTDDVDKNNGALLELLKDKVSENYKYLSASTLAILDKNILATVFPELTKLKDKDGLIKIADLKENFTYKFHGVFVHNSLPLCIYSHSYFRKSLSRLNNFHYLFLDELMSHQDNEEVTLKIGLDWDIIGYAPTFLQAIELEFWFGPKYDDDIANIRPGLTKHICSDFEKSYYEVSATEFYWKKNKELKEFELEELREENAPTLEDFFGCRYVHSIYDTTKNTFVHFDGAIRGYSSDLYFDRIDQNMTEFGRRSDYTKLFRIDGKLELKDWKILITKYMQGNPLIYEYFDIDKPKSQFGSEHTKKTLQQELVPQSIDEGDGIRLLVSYHQKNEGFEEYSHSVSIYDVMESNGESQSVLEYDILEIKKALDRLNKNLFIKEDTFFGVIEDDYWNIPCIFHSDDNPQEDVKITLLAIKKIFDKITERGLDKVISFTLSWNMEDKEVRVSCFGHIKDLQKWLLSFDEIPTNREAFKIWLDNQKKYLNTNYERQEEKPKFQDISQFDGVIYIKRKIVEDKFEPTPSIENKQIICTIKIPNNKHYSDIKNGYITPVMACIPTKSICSKSNLDYKISPYSKFLDDDVYTKIEKFEGLCYYWSDKPINK